MSEWKDRPSEDGWWWLSSTPPTAHKVKGEMFLEAGDWRLVSTLRVEYKWLRIPDPPPVPVPLPKSRTVELTARVWREGIGHESNPRWRAEVRMKESVSPVDGDLFDHPEAKRLAIDFCRNNWGIEPEVKSNG